MRFFVICSLVVFLFSPLVVSAQQPVVTNLRQEFSFDPYPDAAAQISNELLQHISQGNGRLRAYTHFTVRASMVSELEKKAADMLAVSVKISGVTYSGDVMYRDFSLEKILLPNRMDVTLQVLDADGQLLREINLKDTRVPANGGGVLTLELPGELRAQAATVKPVAWRLFYSAEAFRRFDGWFDALEKYYASGELLDGVGAMINGIDPDSVEALMLNEFTLCEAEELYRRMKYGSFHHWIDLHKSDPQQIMVRLKELEGKMMSLRGDLNASIAVIDSLLYHHGLQAASEDRTDDARDHFAGAVTYNPFHVGAHLSIARIDLHKGDKVQALQRMGGVISRMYPPEQELELAHEITTEILDVFFSEAQELTWAHRYLNALETLEPVEDFCRQTSGFMECPDELHFRIKASHMGMYRSFLTVSARARQDNNLSFAETYIMSAIEYQQKNTTYLPDDHEAMEQLQMVLTRYVENGILNMETSEYRKAIDEFTRALNLSERFPGLLCPAETQSLLARAVRLEKEAPADLPEEPLLMGEPEGTH